MSRNLLCPVCGAEISLEQLEQAGDLLALQRAAGAFGDDWALIREYLELFRGKQPLKVAKLLRLAREVWQMWHAGQFEFQRGWYTVGREEFREALKATCNQVSGPLSNHNYLKKVLLAGAKQTSQRREREFKEREQGLMGGRAGQAGGTPALPELQDLPEDPEWQKKFQELSRLVRKPCLTPEARKLARLALEEHLGKGRA